MVGKSVLEPWVYNSLKVRGGRARITEVAQDIWDNHEDELRRSGDLFYTWQYDMRWAAQRLQDRGQLRKIGTTGIWELR